MHWTKVSGEEWTCRVPPDARFTLKALATQDRRWQWEVFTGPADRPNATGLVSSLGAAKNAAELFLKKAGHV